MIFARQNNGAAGVQSSVFINRLPRRVAISAILTPTFFALTIALLVLFAIERQPELPPGVLLTGNPSFDGAPLGMQWVSAVLNAAPAANSDINSPLEVAAFSVYAKTIGSDAVTLKEAYIESSIDFTKIEIKVSTPPGPMYSIDQISPIQPNAWVYFVAQFDHGIPEQAFLDRWRSFHIIIRYDDKSIRRYFDSNWVSERLIGLHPNSAPHVSPKH